jgi:hypothetical protein
MATRTRHLRRTRRFGMARPSGVDASVPRALADYVGPHERVVLATRQHPFAIARAFAQAMLVFVPLLLLTWGSAGLEPLRGLPARVLGDLGITGMLATIGWLAWQVLGWELTHLYVTTEKVVLVRGVALRRISSTPLVKVSELAVVQPLLGRLFGYGALVLESPGGGDRALHGLAWLPDPASLYRTINGLARRERAWEGGALVGGDQSAPPAPADGAA